MQYADNDQYQRQVADRYKQRIGTVDRAQVCRAVEQLGIRKVTPNDLVEAATGNMNATFLTNRYAIKVNQRSSEEDYLASAVASKHLAGRAPVPRVLAYDFFDQTPFELIVMERLPGEPLLASLPDLDGETHQALFRQLLETVRAFHAIPFQDFGEFRNGESFNSFTSLLQHAFNEHAAAIRKNQLAKEEDLARIEQHFAQNVAVFDGATAVFAPTDLHAGNILHVGVQLTGVIDFDGSLKAPAVQSLPSLLGYIGNPAQFVEGTPDFERMKNARFPYLLPILEEELPELMQDPQLLRKLNVLVISECMFWIADNWSPILNRSLVEQLLKYDLPENELQLSQTHYGRILAGKAPLD